MPHNHKNQQPRVKCLTSMRLLAATGWMLKKNDMSNKLHEARYMNNGNSPLVGMRGGGLVEQMVLDPLSNLDAINWAYIPDMRTFLNSDDKTANPHFPILEYP